MKSVGKGLLGAVAIGVGLWLARTDLPPVELELSSWTAWLLALVVMLVAMATRIGSWILLGACALGLAAAVVSAMGGRPWGMLLALSVVGALAALFGIVVHHYAATAEAVIGAPDSDSASG